jgi:hypothetical protein
MMKNKSLPANKIPFMSKYITQHEKLLQSSTMPFCADADSIKEGIQILMEAEREYILSQCHSKYLKQFGAVGNDLFMDHSRKRLCRRRVQIMNPYQVPPGIVRAKWMTEFVRVSAAIKVNVDWERSD